MVWRATSQGHSVNRGKDLAEKTLPSSAEAAVNQRDDAEARPMSQYCVTGSPIRNRPEQPRVPVFAPAQQHVESPGPDPT